MPATPRKAGDSDPLIGQLVGGRYRVLGVIGIGGMGVVYDALHEELERAVALKVLSAAWASDEEAILRFQREARTSSNIGHPHIIDVYDLGRLGDGRPYLAMERLRGVSLADLLEDETGLPPRRVMLWIRQAASALDAVHSRGIIHRDIKPENFIIQHDETGESIKLLDFGLAAFALPSEEHQRITRAGQIHGTPHYMAPESGGDQQPDQRADVYSIAVVAYELLCGVLPFDSSNPLHILTEKMRRDPPTMSERCGVVFPEELEEVLGRGLAREPEQRYATAGELARDLEAVLARVADQLPSPAALAAANAFADAIDPQAHSDPPEDGGTSGVHPPTERDLTHESAGDPVPVKRVPWVAVAVTLLGAAAAVVLYTLPFAAEEAPHAASRVEEVTSRPTPFADESGAAHAAGTAEAAPSEPAPLDLVPRGEPTPPLPEPDPPNGGGDHGTTSGGDHDTTSGEDTAAASRRASSKPRRPPTRVAEKSPRPAPATASGDAPAHDAPERGEARDDEPPPALAEQNRARAAELSREGTKALVQGRLPEAIRLFREATLAFPRHAPAWRGLGLANERLGRQPEALRAYRRYLQTAPGAPDARSVRERVSALEGGGATGG